MKKAIKWVLIAGGVIVALIIIALLAIPMFVDVQKYKPEIEEWVSETTGRPFVINGDLDLSLFPWAGISFSDLHLGNPSGFKEKDFLSVKSFEVRVKLLPLISRDIQVSRFIVGGPRIVLEKNKSGRVNWEGLGKPSEEKAPKPSKDAGKKPAGEPGAGLPIKGLAVGEMAITDGSLLWLDQVTGERKEVSDVNFRLKDVSLDRPVRIAFSAKVDGKPLEMSGNVGPVGREPGKGTIAVDLKLKALKKLEMDINGELVDAATRQAFDMAIQIPPFSPRELVKALGEEFPLKTADPAALNSVAFKAKLKGTPQNVSVSDGILSLDDSELKFFAKVKEFSKPDLAFNLDMNKIDLDRYLPPPSQKKPAPKEEPPEAAKKKTDYVPLRKLVLDGTIKIGELKAHGARIQDLGMKLTGRNGVFSLDPLDMKLYQGDVSSKGTFDVRQDIPKADMALKATGIKVNPLLKDVLNKDFLEGTVKATMKISMTGDDSEMIKGTLNGEGDFLFNDGAIVGIDLAGMVRNIKATFGLAEKGTERPRTDFSELHSPFTITKGVVDTRNTRLASPLLRVSAQGKANLVEESLDFRVEPKFVTTIKGQGDTKERTGLMVPVLVTGSFSSPKFRPDLKGMLHKEIEKGIPEPSELKKMLPGRRDKTEKGEQESIEEGAKEFLKGLRRSQ